MFVSLIRNVFYMCCVWVQTSLSMTWKQVSALLLIMELLFISRYLWYAWNLCGSWHKPLYMQRRCDGILLYFMRIKLTMLFSYTC